MPWWSAPKRRKLVPVPASQRRFPVVEDLGSAAGPALLRTSGVPTNFRERHRAVVRALGDIGRVARVAVPSDPLTRLAVDPLLARRDDALLASKGVDPLLARAPAA